MDDHIIRATAAGGTVRAFAAVTTRMAAKAAGIHGLSPVAAAALGRTMTAAAIMSQLLKGPNDTITVQIKGSGPLGGIVTVSDSKANVRGYVHNPHVYLPPNGQGKLDVSGALGRGGYLNVIRDMGLKEPYIGYVDLASGEIAEDIAYYFAYSEQVPSVVSLGVLVDKDESVLNSGGFFIQLMPGAEEDVIQHIEGKVDSLPSVTSLLSAGETPEGILHMLLGEKALRVADKVPCEYRCNCSRDRMERNMLSLGKTEIMKMIEEQHEAEAQCHFCNTKYMFSEDELLKLASTINLN